MRVLIADDESGARAKVKRFLTAHSDCELVGEAEDGNRALDLLCEHKPDLIFLDINMPGLDGFEVLQALESSDRPLVIFATAYSDRAVRAFEVSAVDYLLKPFDRTRFDAALERVRDRFVSKDRARPGEGVMRVLSDLVAAKQYPTQLLVADGQKLLIVPCEEIDYIESAANYVVLHASSGKHILRSSLLALMAKLDPVKFCRIHRQFIVRVQTIAEIQPFSKGDMVLILKRGAKLKMSRRYKEDLYRLLGQP